MGEIADDMIDGYACSWCGIYFDGEHGYPVVCSSCYGDWLEDDGGNKKKLKKLGVQVANIKEL